MRDQQGQSARIFYSVSDSDTGAVPRAYLNQSKSREFQIPCVMTAHLSDSPSRYVEGGDNEEHFAMMIKALDGKKVQLDCEGDVGQVKLVD